MEEITFWIIMACCFLCIVGFILYIYFNNISTMSTPTPTPTPTTTISKTTSTPTPTPTNIIQNDLSLSLDDITKIYPNVIKKQQTSNETMLLTFVPSYTSDVVSSCINPNNCDTINSNTYLSCAPGYKRNNTTCQLDFTNPLNTPLVPTGYNVCHSYFDNSNTNATTNATQNFIIDYRKNCT
jgi:hypothetical protein